MLKGSQTKGGLIKEHILWAQDKDVCDQCVRPWHNGLCSCGHWDDENIKIIKEIAMDLIKSGKSLNKY